MIDLLRPFISRLIAGPVVAIVGWLAVHYHIVIDPSYATTKVTEAVIVIFGVLSPLAGILKQIIDVKLNPSNAAHPKLAEIGKQEAKNPLITPTTTRSYRVGSK